MILQYIYISIIGILIFNNGCSNAKSTDNKTNTPIIHTNKNIKTGAEQTEKYLHLIENKKVGIVTNQTGVISTTHIVDSLKSLGVDIVKIFAPEHGFRGFAEAGETVKSNIDKKTGIKIISLYGNYYKPRPKDLEDIDIILFDIQDVGARFYTYISTMHYVMESCAENKIPIIILDRPNPNGFYVDGPILNPKYKSFIGMHPIPIVHGMTVGELAKMINGEGWLEGGIKCELTVIPVSNYSHKDLYKLPIAPSPNLQSYNSVILYPSLCLFEGTIISIGRGTETPFEIFGHPKLTEKSFSFTPESRPGFSAKPLYLNEICYGLNLKNYADSIIANPKIELKWLINSYNQLKNEDKFFLNNMFDKLTGSEFIRNSIISGKSEQEIRESWQIELIEFKKKRKQYLLYEDFE